MCTRVVCDVLVSLLVACPVLAARAHVHCCVDRYLCIVLCIVPTCHAVAHAASAVGEHCLVSLVGCYVS